MVVITVRVIRSFEYRTCRNVVVRDVDPASTSVQVLVDRVFAEMQKGNLTRLLLQFPEQPENYYRSFYNTLKLYMQPHGAKPNNTIINVGKDEELLLRDWSVPLATCNVGNETELSLFNQDDYQTYLLDPTQKWTLHQ